MKTMTFLVNPRGKKRRASGRGTQRRTKRPPPKGWSSWKAYMASIRPGAKKAKRVSSSRAKSRRRTARASTSSGSESMAKHKTKTRHARRGATAARKHHTTHRRRRHVRRNPQGIHASSLGAKLKAAPKFALETVMHAGEAIAGKVVARKVRGLVNQQPGTVVGSLIEAGVGLVGGMVISMVAPGIGEYFALGGVMAPMETAIQQLKIPHVSDSLGDDGYLVGGDSGVTLVSAYPDDYRTSLGRYVSPPRPAPVVLVTDSKYESKHAA